MRALHYAQRGGDSGLELVSDLLPSKSPERRIYLSLRLLDSQVLAALH